ncbi:putative odorant-binding protein A10 [Formica fusca]|uniref:ejaculatory bulb-specific protein 3-like n=1 Tax=Formica exsecta TaxID=72781 RepID=UPI001143C11E|nr:ejaculatory bulb-specific protein 3-like [Formica exsecta]
MIKLAICTFSCLIVTCIVLVAHAADEKYSTKYDNIDVDAVLANPRLRNQYVSCVMGTSACITGSARFLKEKFAEAFVTRCSKCTEKQIYFFDTVTEWFMKNEPDTFHRVVEIAIKQRKNA